MSEKKPTLLYLIGIVILFVVAGGVVTLWLTRTASAKAEAEERKQEVQSGPMVRLARAALSPAGRKLELQGEARPFASVTLYAKISGYLKRILVDKGDRVRADQLIAEVESPELDRQYEAAVADAKYKQADAKRTAALAGPGVVSARDAELSASQANVADAQVRAMNTQREYQVLRAPFTGTVTARFVDPGMLVQSAANAQTSAQPVVTISQTEKLRVYVYVDQRDAADVKVGDQAEVRTPDRPATEKPRIGQVTRLSRELDVKTRTMLVEVDLDNKDNAIVAGSFVQVSLSLKSAPRVELPVETLVLRGKSAFVPVVKDGVVNYRPVLIAENDGARVRLAGGVAVGEEVALNLGDSVADGTHVRPAAAPTPPPAK
jgi:RND family efflux transporter MFP subunit